MAAVELFEICWKKKKGRGAHWARLSRLAQLGLAQPFGCAGGPMMSNTYSGEYVSTYGRVSGRWVTDGGPAWPTGQV